MTTVSEPRSRKVARIVKDPRMVGGEPTIAGTRVPVRSVLLSYQRYEGNLERVCAAHTLKMVEAQAALDYYADHRDEIDQHIRENERIAMSADDSALRQAAGRPAWPQCASRRPVA